MIRPQKRALQEAHTQAGGQDAAAALSLLGSVLQMWHMCSLRHGSWSSAGCQGCQGPEVTTKMSLLFLEQDHAGLTYEELAVSVLRPLLQHFNEGKKKLCYILDSVKHSRLIILLKHQASSLGCCELEHLLFACLIELLLDQILKKKKKTNPKQTNPKKILKIKSKISPPLGK